MNNKIIIGLAGQMASGKGTVAQYLKDKYGADFFTFSTPLRDILNRLYVEINRQNLIDVSTILRNLFGQDLLAKIIAKDIEKSEKNLIIIDGVRRPTDIEFLKKIEGFILIKVTANEKTRFKRLIERAQNQGDKQKTFEEFLVDHQRETEITIPLVMAEAKEEIDNNGDLQNLYSQTEKLIKKYAETK